VDQAAFFTLVLRGDFLTPSATSTLIDQALASRSAVAMDGLLEATLLSVEADSKQGQLEQGRPRRVQVLMAAFEGLGPGADDSMRAVLRQDTAAADAFAKAILAVLKVRGPWISVYAFCLCVWGYSHHIVKRTPQYHEWPLTFTHAFSSSFRLTLCVPFCTSFRRR
jgi:hypothetical protein